MNEPPSSLIIVLSHSRLVTSTKQDEPAMSRSDLIGLLGGMLGLWLGVSIVHLLQVIYYIFTTVQSKVCKWLPSNRTRPEHVPPV